MVKFNDMENHDMPVNKLILGDNLEVLKQLDDESIDLIYLDPPFFSNRNYEVIWGDSGEIRSFQDRWSGGMDKYIDWLKERVEQMYRVLKKTGCLFLHCDWHASHYIKTEILDKLFSLNNFRNEIIWKRADTHNDAKKQFPIVFDSIFYYTKSSKYVFNKQFTSHSDKTLREWYQYLEFPDGTIRKMTKEELETQTIPSNARRFNADNMASPNPRPNLMYEYKGYGYPTKGWRYSLETMQELDRENKLLFPENKNGRIMRKRYLDEQQGSVIGNLWTDIDQIRAAKTERIGYPTQKPEELLKRIIECASEEGDIILDPFVGGGTTVAVADRLNRRWIGIDQSVQAVKLSELRLNNQQDLFSNPFVVQLQKYDYDYLRNKDAFDFENWIVLQYGGYSNSKQRGDSGIDGKLPDNTPIQVKRSDGIGRNVIDNFKSAIERFDKKLFTQNVKEKKRVGVLIAFSFGKGAVEEVSRLKLKENVIIELVTVESIVPISKKPTLKIDINDMGKDNKGLTEIEFIASGTSDAGIEFYSWDFNFDTEKKQFKPSILLDKEGKQKTKFKAGIHNIAVKVVDNDGLENIEIIKIKINGKTERE